MSFTFSSLRHFSVEASDGDLGRVADVFFEDATWTARYLAVETGGWLRHRRILVSPIAVNRVSAETRSLSVTLNRSEVANSPTVDTELPLSRQMELRYRNYFAWPLYWVATFVSAYDPSRYPALARLDEAIGAGRIRRREPLMPEPRQDPHLRSADKITGYAVMARDGMAGRVTDFVLDSDGWRIDALLVDTEHWPHHRRVQLATDAVTDIDWAMSCVHVPATRAEVARAPEYGAVAAR